MNDAIKHVIQFFLFGNQPKHLHDMSKAFSLLAWDLARQAPQSRETAVALRKLLEARDAALRAVIDTPRPNGTTPPDYT